MKYLLVKSLFCPNYEYYETTIKSIIKNDIFINLIMKRDIEIDIDILYIGWVNIYDDLFNSFVKIYKKKNIYLDLWPLNYGKYELYNRLIDFVKSHNDYNFVIYMDHDIYFDFNSIDIFSSINSIKDFTIKNVKLGMIAFNQKMDIRHKNDIYENIIDHNKLQLVYPHIDGSIAGGAFIIDTNILMNMDYFEKISIYGLDDYYFAKRLTDSNYINVVIANIFVIHPFDNNNIYSSWKKNHLLKLLHGTHGSYFQEIQNSINFWAL